MPRPRFRRELAHRELGADEAPQSRVVGGVDEPESAGPPHGVDAAGAHQIAEVARERVGIREHATALVVSGDEPAAQAEGHRERTDWCAFPDRGELRDGVEPRAQQWLSQGGGLSIKQGPAGTPAGAAAQRLHHPARDGPAHHVRHPSGTPHPNHPPRAIAKHRRLATGDQRRTDAGSPTPPPRRTCVSGIRRLSPKTPSARDAPACTSRTPAGHVSR
jgi:hypothetical protein